MRSGWTTVVCEVRFAPRFEGEYKPGVAVQCYGLFGDLLSFENVATQLVARLSQRFAGVAAHDYRRSGAASGASPGVFSDLSFLTPDAPIGVYHGLPYGELPEAMARHRFRVGCLVCDADVVPPGEIRTCHDSFDLVVVPSDFCRRVFQASGLQTPIRVVPHGVSPNFAPVANRRPDVFTFYNVFDQVRDYRKSSAELIRCFVKAFDRDPGIRLRLRTAMSDTLTAQLDEADAWAVVTVDEHPLPEPRYARVFSEVHATVHPSKAEGFGMVPLQSLACATPVIAPFTTGLRDYLRPDNAMRLKTAGMVPALGDAGLEAGGEYHGIDEQHLVRCLRAMYDNWPQQAAKAEAAAPRIRKRYGWAYVLEPLLDILAAQLDRSMPAGEPAS